MASAFTSLWIPVFFGLVHTVISGNGGKCRRKSNSRSARYPPEKTGMTWVVAISGFIIDTQYSDACGVGAGLGHVFYMLTCVMIALCLEMFLDVLTLMVLLLSFAYWAMRHCCCKNFGA